MTIQFKVGETYSTRSICDYECIFSFGIVSRTAKTVKVMERGKIKTCKISIHNGAEMIKPHGSYSMCCILTAEDTSDKIQAEQARAIELATQRVEKAKFAHEALVEFVESVEASKTDGAWFN